MNNGFSHNKKLRKINTLTQPKKYLIFCEGKCTEPEYFDAFKTQINKNAIYKDQVIVETHGLGKNTKSVVRAAESYIKKNKPNNAIVWCVFDKDSFKPDNYDNAVKMCKQKGFNCACSNECIEFWFILHFAYYTSNNHRSDYMKFLDNKYKELGKGKYKKNDINNYEILKKYGNPSNAIKYAKRIIKQYYNKTPSESAPSTKVYLLVEELIKYLPESEKEYFV